MDHEHRWGAAYYGVASVDPADDVPAVIGENAGPCIQVYRDCPCGLIQRETARDVWEDWFDLAAAARPLDLVIEEAGPVSGHLPRGHAFECKEPCANPMCVNFDSKVLAARIVATQPMMPLTEAGAMLAKELVEESFQAALLADRIIVIITRVDGREYQISPAGPLRRLWNWLRGYRPSRPA